MRENFLIVLSCGTDNPNRSTRGLFLAMAAHKAGKNTTVFLLDEGVSLAKEGQTEHLKAATGDNADDHLSYLQANNVPILVCTPCAAARGISEKDLVECARMAAAAELIEMACNAAVISL